MAAPLRVLIDLRWMRPGVAGGIENLSRAFLERLFHLDRFNEYTVLVPAEVRYDFDARGCRNFRFAAADGPGAWMRRVRMAGARVLSSRLGSRFRHTPQLKAPWRVRGLGAEVALSVPGYIHPDVASLPNVLIMPDVQHEYRPEFFARRELEERRRLYTASAKQAAHICAISEFTRRTLIDRLGIPPDRVTTTLPAADPVFHPGSASRSDSRRVLEKYGLKSGDYLLFPSNTWPHKNHGVALQALCMLREAYGLAPLLVCTGSPKAAHDDVVARIRDLRLDGQVRFLGYCPTQDMPGLYEGAAALVLPSLFEGFGLPLLEAMWCDCPVVCSNATSLPEIGGDAALLVDPESPEALAHAIKRVLTDEELRYFLIERGRRRVRSFSWPKFTLEMVRILHAVGRRRDG
jgi:glycosyltransferase involved in cell wall biosynthesis